MIWPRLLYLLATWPAFYLMVRNHDAPTLLGATALLATLSFLSTAPSLVCITESLAKEIRGTGVGTIQAVAVAIFGATTQPTVAWLIHSSGNRLSPAWYLMAFTVLGLTAAVLMRETAPGHDAASAWSVKGFSTAAAACRSVFAKGNCLCPCTQLTMVSASGGARPGRTAGYLYAPRP